MPRRERMTWKRASCPPCVGVTSNNEVETVEAKGWWSGGSERNRERKRERERERRRVDWTLFHLRAQNLVRSRRLVWSGLVWSGLVVTEAPPPNRSAHLGRQVDRTPREKVQKDTGPQTGGGGWRVFLCAWFASRVTHRVHRLARSDLDLSRDPSFRFLVTSFVYSFLLL